MEFVFWVRFEHVSVCVIAGGPGGRGCRLWLQICDEDLRSLRTECRIGLRIEKHQIIMRIEMDC